MNNIKPRGRSNVFINKCADTLLFVNYKCASASIRHLQRIGEIDEYFDTDFSRYRLMAFVRDPYKRIESYYRDKFLMVKKFEQNTHKFMFRFIPEERIVNREVDLEEFINVLKHGFGKDTWGDGHLHAQHVKIPAAVTELYKIEDGNFEAFEKAFGTKMLKRNETSRKLDVELVWTPEMRNIVYRKYKKDFIRFGYPRYID